jgi:hypothetical protein
MAFIGSADSDLVDSFDAVVCTPTWLAANFGDPRISRAHFESHEPLFGNRFLFMKRWDYDALHTAVSHDCALQQAEDLGTLASRIGRRIPWEFDFQYDDFIDKTASQRPAFPPDKRP